MSLSKHAKTYLLNQSKYRHLNAFNSLVEPHVLTRNDAPTKSRLGEQPANSITGKPIAIKDNICTKQLRTTASSGILKDFSSPYDATVVKLLQDEGAVVVGKTNMDEFGMGSHSTHSHFGPVKMQRYEGEESSVGGSSGGSALAVATSQCWA
jgi:aspartyl-tRNA(Asn)/glutamyl-tRNA(Gln) amidotransferase subunit A